MGTRYQAAPPRKGDLVVVEAVVGESYGTKIAATTASGVDLWIDPVDAKLVKTGEFIPGDLVVDPMGAPWTVIAVDGDEIWARKLSQPSYRRTFEPRQIERAVAVEEPEAPPSPPIPSDWPPPDLDADLAGYRAAQAGESGETPAPSRVLPPPGEGNRWEARDGLAVLVVPGIGWDLRGAMQAVAAADLVVTETGSILKAKDQPLAAETYDIPF